MRIQLSNNKYLFHWATVLAFFSMLASCKTNGKQSFTLQRPNNLQTKLIVVDSILGLVKVEAFAENANHYTVDVHGPDGFVSKASKNEGLFDFELIPEGTYHFNIKAVAMENAFVEENKSITFVKPNPLLEYDKGYKSPKSYDGYRLVWEDEFNRQELDEKSWTFQLGTGREYGLYGWGNNELQFYRSENTILENGYLKILAKKEDFSGQEYTSSRIYTIGKKAFQYGRFDIRAKLPVSQGMWPAIWMLGENINDIGWPKCGEIDIMEIVGKQPRHLLGTLHWHNDIENQKVQSGGEIWLGHDAPGFDEEFHVFSIVWNSTEIIWYLDNQPYASIDIRPSHMSEFHKPFHFLFNVAIGGNWPGSPDQSTIFPSEMAIDYIRVFQK